MSTTIRSTLKELYLDKRISNISYQLSKQLAEFECSEEKKELCALVTSCVTSALEQGNVCIDITQIDNISGTPLSRLYEQAELELMSVKREDVMSLLAVTDHSEPLCTPLVLRGNLLYMNRSYRSERVVAEAFGCSKLVDVDSKVANQVLNELFPRPYSLLIKATKEGKRDLKTCFDILNVTKTDNVDLPSILSVLENADSCTDFGSLDHLIPSENIIDWQKVAVATALLNRVAVISGGPGTGKTTTVCKLLAAIIALSNNAPIIKITAPTGKAAARLTESISKTLHLLDLDERIKSAIPTGSSTLHRLLGATYGKSEYRFNKNNKLNLDVLVIDEASMVDLTMMSGVISALPENARLILLGDKDQLSSVDAGSVLGDICSFYGEGQSDQLVELINELTEYCLPLNHSPPTVADKICVLQKSHRFHSKSGIGKLAKAVNAGYYNRAFDILESDHDDIAFFDLNEQTYSQLLNEVCRQYERYLTSVINGDIKAAITEFNKTRLLCAIRETEFGVEKNNKKIEHLLSRKRLISPLPKSLWYSGRPIMVIKNDYGLGLYNGDIGITLRDQDGTLKVYFEMQDGTIKGFLTSRVPEHELAFCMTMHKSQGSEFEHAYILMPPNKMQVSTRELIYTGITRAKKKLSIFATKDSFMYSIKSKTVRHSGLKQQLGSLTGY